MSKVPFKNMQMFKDTWAIVLEFYCWNYIERIDKTNTGVYTNNVVRFNEKIKKKRKESVWKLLNLTCIYNKRNTKSNV